MKLLLNIPTTTAPTDAMLPTIAAVCDALSRRLPAMAYDYIGLGLSREQYSPKDIAAIADAIGEATCILEIRLLD